MTGRPWSAATVLAFGLSACGTTAPTRYLTLAATPPERPALNGAGLVLRPPDVRWPAAFNRLEVARPTGGVEVTVEELARWSAAPGRLADDAPILGWIRSVDAHLGIRSHLDCASTDANIPLSSGLPAISPRVGL